MENLSIIIRDVRNRGIKVLLVQQAHAPLRLLHDVHELFFLYRPLISSANKELQRRYGVAVFDAQAYFDQFENPRRLFLNPKYDAIHMNTSGSRALAEGLFKALRNHLSALASP